jgi:hypothetical protein
VTTNVARGLSVRTANPSISAEREAIGFVGLVLFGEFSAKRFDFLADLSS